MSLFETLGQKTIANVSTIIPFETLYDLLRYCFLSTHALNAKETLYVSSNFSVPLQDEGDLRSYDLPPSHDGIVVVVVFGSI